VEEEAELLQEMEHQGLPTLAVAVADQEDQEVSE
jgi:hypothetical protein